MKQSVGFPKKNLSIVGGDQAMGGSVKLHVFLDNWMPFLQTIDDMHPCESRQKGNGQMAQIGWFEVCDP